MPTQRLASTIRSVGNYGFPAWERAYLFNRLSDQIRLNATDRRNKEPWLRKMEYPHQRPSNLLGALNIDSARGRAREIYSHCFLQPWTPRFVHFPLSRVASESPLSLSLRARFFLSAERPSSYLRPRSVLSQKGERERERKTEADTAARRILRPASQSPTAIGNRSPTLRP